MNAIGGTYDNSTALLHENQRRAARRHVVKLDEDGNPIAQEDDQEAQEDDDGFSIRTESVKDVETSKEVFVTQADDAVLHPPTEEESQAAVAAAGSALEEALAEAGMGEESGNGTASGGGGEAGSEGTATGGAPAVATETATASASATAGEAATAGTTPGTEGGVAAGEGGAGPSDGSGEGKEGVDELEAEAAVVLEAEGEGGAIGDAEAAAAAAMAAAAAEEEALAAAEAAAEEAAAAAAAAEAAATARAAANAALAEENRQYLLATLRSAMATKAEAESENAALHLHLATWCTANVKTSATAASLLSGGGGGGGGPPPTSASGPKRVPVTSLDTPLARQLKAREEAAARLKNEELRGAFTKERGRKERELAHYDGKAAALQATLEAREGHLNAVTKAFRAYKREVCATAAHSVTGKRLPPGLVSGYEAGEAEVDAAVAKAELKHTSMVYALRAARAAAAASATAAAGGGGANTGGKGGPPPLDAATSAASAAEQEQLRLENLSLAIKLEEVSREVSAAGKKASLLCHTLTHVREKVPKLVRERDALAGELGGLEGELNGVRGGLAALKKGKEGLAAANAAALRRQGFVFTKARAPGGTAMHLAVDYERLMEESLGMKRELEELQARYLAAGGKSPLSNQGGGGRT